MAASEPDKKGCCSVGPLKVILAILNVFYFLLGGVLLALGIIAIIGSDILDDIVSSGDVLEEIPELAESAGLTDTDKLKGKLKLEPKALSMELAIAFIVVGGILVLLSIEGFMGICHKETCALWMYVICVSIMLLVQVACVAAFFAGALTDPIRSRLTDNLEKKYKGFDDYESSESVLWNYLMLEFECCGVDGYKDFKSSKSKWNKEREFGNDTVTLEWPIACCMFKNKFTEFKNVSCARSEDPDSSNREEGCWDALVDYLQGFKMRAIIAIVIVFLFQATIIVITAVLLSIIRKEEQEGGKGADDPKPNTNKNRVEPADPWN